MKNEKLLRAIGKIDDELVYGATPKKALMKRPVWMKWSTVVACLVLVLAVAIPLIIHHQNVTENEPRIILSLQEAQENVPFGNLFPTEILDGYVLEGEIAIYDETVLQAKFYNSNSNDELTIRIAAKEYFGEVETNTVLYRDNLENKGSLIYIEGEDYIVCYTFSESDINDVQGFRKMVDSATYFSAN